MPFDVEKIVFFKSITSLVKCCDFKRRILIMNIDTKYFGTCKIDEKDIIHFESGLPGFLDEKKFVVLPFDEASPFYLLQSVSTPTLAFTIMSPFYIHQAYDFEIPDPVVKSLALTDEKDIAVFVILTIHDPFEASTANLKAPVIINTERKVGKQIVLTDTAYLVQHPLRLVKTSAGQEG